MAPARHGAREQRLTGGESELCAQEVDDTGGVGRLFHLARLCSIGGERLLAHDVAAGGHRSDDQLFVGMGRRRHAHHVGTRERERIAERDQRVRDSESGRPLAGPLRFAPDERLHLKAGGLQGPHVGQAPESGSRRPPHPAHQFASPSFTPVSTQPADVGRIVAVPAVPGG